MKAHPNKTPFLGILTLLDTPSDKAPSGARGHRVILTKEAATVAIDSLIGMGIDIAPDLRGHNATQKSGVITGVEIIGLELQVSGYIWGRDCPAILDRIQASSEELGMSYELADARVEDMRAEVWKLTRVTFTGAAILFRSQAAYRATEFLLI
jgi:hypothetical protein